MRVLYLAGLLVLDVVVLALGVGMIAAMDLDKAGTVGVLATMPVVLLVLPDLPAAHVTLRLFPADSDVQARREDRRPTVVLASVLTAAGAVPLLVLTAAAEGPVLLAAGCSALAALALVYAFLVGERVARRPARSSGMRMVPARR